MPGFLKSTPVTDAERRAHDRHRPQTVLAVLAVIAAYVYLFTALPTQLGLPAAGQLVEGLGLEPNYVFADSGTVDHTVIFELAEQLPSNADDHLAFYLVLVVAFLSFYFLPVPLKQPALAFWSIVVVAIIYGIPATAGLLMAHGVSYLVFHPTKRWHLVLLPGLLGGIAFVPPGAGAVEWFSYLVFGALLFAAAYRLVLLPLLGMPRVEPILRTLVAQSAIITVVLFALYEGLTGQEFDLQLGILLFFWQWCRLIMYQIDYKDGMVPRDTSLGSYLAVFFSPGALPSWTWGVELGLGYAYCNNTFLCEDKNRTVQRGVKMLWLALGYLVLGDWARHLLMDAIEATGVELYDGWITTMVGHFMRGDEISPASVMLTSLIDTLRWTIAFVGVVHFKTGVWRICGYNFEAYFNRPWLSTNLVVFWSRYTYYYREFLLQAFYYPIFFRYFRRWPKTRIIVATMAAAAGGNMIWGHVTERLYDHGMTFDQITYVFHTWPYYVLLGGAITLTELYLLNRTRKRKRKPWTRGPWLAIDVIGSYCTMQYFAVIHIFSRPADGSTEWDLFRLFLRGFGIHL